MDRKYNQEIGEKSRQGQTSHSCPKREAELDMQNIPQADSLAAILKLSPFTVKVNL